MEPTTIRLESDELAAIDEEAEERGFSNRAGYLRWIIRNRPSSESLVERLDSVEARLDRVEKQNEE